MPAILAQDDYESWLANTTAPALPKALVASRPNQMLRTYPVAKAVGNVRNDNPEMTKPIKAECRPHHCPRNLWMSGEVAWVCID